MDEGSGGGSGSGSGVNSSFSRQSMKRSFDTMTESHRERQNQWPQHDDDTPSLFVPQDNHYTNEHATRRQRLALPALQPSMRSRFPGDGLDFRTPVMSSSAAPQVIDLTEEDASEISQSRTGRCTRSRTPAIMHRTAGSSRAQRLPRYERDIIEIEAEGDDQGNQGSHATNHSTTATLGLGSRHEYSGLRRPPRQPTPPRDFDVEFVAERPRSPQGISRQHTPARFAPRSPSSFSAIDLTQDDDVVITETRQREGGINAQPPAVPNSFVAEMGGRFMARFGALGGMVDGELRAQQQAMEHFRHNHDYDGAAHRHHHHHHHHHSHQRHHHQHMRAPPAGGHIHVRPARGAIPNMPDRMNFEAVGFDMGMPGGNRPLTPKYSPPPAPQPGFTRSPEEDEELVCPNCGDELAMGDDDVKQQIWVVKGCGHAYCGECAQNRFQTASRKGKGKATDANLPPSFKKCVVEGCGCKTTVKNAMIHVYLGS